jgi:hypothetical protein
MPQVMYGKEATLTGAQVGIRGRALGRETTRDSDSSLPLLLKTGQVLP